MNWLNRYADLVYCIARLVIGLLFACHGGTKIFGFPASQYGPSHSTLGLVSGGIELICGFLVALGFFTRVAAFFASGEMAVAYFMFSFGRGFFPISNGGELAVVYCFAFFLMVFYGSGSWSVDSALTQKAASRSGT
ncbi:MAG TPA: DoxX family protein [Chthoniobacterales bacterium]|nr:DoxX family protein [Chthoniobacterales bacterium]